MSRLAIQNRYFIVVVCLIIAVDCHVIGLLSMALKLGAGSESYAPRAVLGV